jgi:3-oxoacyl-(acyl-carrier-protein) synthase
MISFDALNSFSMREAEPGKASRPFDGSRDGLVPGGGGAMLILESLESAKARDARIFGEVVAYAFSSDGDHLTLPSGRGAKGCMEKALATAGLKVSDIDYVNAHATSTPLGDITEIHSIKSVFGEHAWRLKINATKSMLGHTCWAAPVVETIAAVLQMNAGWLHPSINIDELDPEVDLDVCAGHAAVKHDIRYLMKNSFGFGGINCVSILKRFEGERGEPR